MQELNALQIADVAGALTCRCHPSGTEAANVENGFGCLHFCCWYRLDEAGYDVYDNGTLQPNGSGICVPDTNNNVTTTSTSGSNSLIYSSMLTGLTSK